MSEIVAEIVTIGDEILYGQITDTNSQWLAEQLGLLGIKVRRKISVGDQMGELLDIFKESGSRADIVILTGGLGPTSDDITKPALCHYFQCGMRMDEKVLAHVTALCEKFGIPVLEINNMQASVPEVAEVLFNTMGTAPGLWIQQKGKVFISLPGVPFEMKEIMHSYGLPKLNQFFKTPVIVHQMIRTIGIGESSLAEKIKTWEQNLPSVLKLAYLPTFGGVKLRITGTGKNLSELEPVIQKQTQELQNLLGSLVYALGNVELEQAVGHLLKEKGLTIATAESCTGGALSSIITSVPGSSSYFIGSIIAYNNTVKIKQLDVAQKTLLEQGAVSEQTVIEMAEGVRKQLGTNIGVAISGIAGPAGGTDTKPVGTIWIAYSDEQKTVTKKLQLNKNRLVNIKYSVMFALNLIRENIQVM